MVGEIIEKMKDAVDGAVRHEGMAPYVRLYIAGISTASTILFAVSVWGINHYIAAQDAAIARAAAVAETVQKAETIHADADLVERTDTSNRFGVDEGRIARMEQNKDDVLGQLQRAATARDGQMNTINATMEKLSDAISDVRSEVSEIKGQLQFAMRPAGGTQGEGPR